MKIKHILIVMMAMSLILITSCQKKHDYKSYNLDPSKGFAVTSVDTTSVAAFSAKLIIHVQTTDTLGIVDNGILISTDPSMSNATWISGKGKKTDATITVPNLEHITVYYWKAYATSLLGGTTFGDVKSFKTANAPTKFSSGNLVGITAANFNALGFKMIDKDGDGRNWSNDVAVGTKFGLGAGQGLVCSWSWAYMETGQPGLTPENYLCLPVLTIDTIRGPIVFSVSSFAHLFNGTTDADAGETFKIVISQTPITKENCQNAEVLLQKVIPSLASYVASINIPASYAGKSAYIAICHFDTEDLIGMYINSISVNVPPAPSPSKNSGETLVMRNYLPLNKTKR